MTVPARGCAAGRWFDFPAPRAFLFLSCEGACDGCLRTFDVLDRLDCGDRRHTGCDRVHTIISPSLGAAGALGTLLGAWCMGGAIQWEPRGDIGMIERLSA